MCKEAGSWGRKKVWGNFGKGLGEESLGFRRIGDKYLAMT